MKEAASFMTDNNDEERGIHGTARRDARGRYLELPPAMRTRQFTAATARETGALAHRNAASTYYEVRRLCRDASPDAVRRIIEIARIDPKSKMADGVLKPLGQKDDIRAILMASNWLVERGYGPPKPYDPREESMFSRFDPSLLLPEERERVREAMELIMRATPH